MAIKDIGTKPIGTLPYTKYEGYYQALMDNDKGKISQMLMDASTQLRDTLLNGQFDFGESSYISQENLERMSRPLLVAAIFGSLEVVELLLEEGADLFQTGFNQGNIVHYIITGCSAELTCEERAVELYNSFVETLEEEKLRKLLMQENQNEMRPLELAANIGCLLLYESIQLTPGMYVTKCIRKGVFKEEWIDVTDYEAYGGLNRRHKSPLFLFAFLDQNWLSGSKNGNILRSDLITLWRKKKMLSIKFILNLWVLLRIFYGVVFFIYITKGHTSIDINVYNNNNSNTPIKTCENRYMYFEAEPIVGTIIVTYLIAHSCLSVLTTFTASFFYYKYKFHLYTKRVDKKKSLIVDFRFYNMCHFLTCVTYVIAGIMSIVDGNSKQVVIDALITMTCITSVWSILYFFQILPFIGHFAIAIQRMIYILIQFTIVFIIFFLPYVHAFYRLLQQNDGCPNPDFSSSNFMQFYNSFLITLNMLDLKTYKDDIVNGDFNVLLCLHVAYVFILPILLLNFLIALFSSSVAEIMENKDIIMAIQKLSVICQTENYMDQSGACLRPIWRFLQRGNFHIEDGKYYLIRITQTKHCKQRVI